METVILKEFKDTFTWDRYWPAFQRKRPSHLVSNEILAHGMFWAQKESLACVSSESSLMSFVWVERPWSALCCPGQHIWLCVPWWLLPTWKVVSWMVPGAGWWYAVATGTSAPPLAGVTCPSHHAPCPLGSCMATPAYLAPWPSASSSGFQICLFFPVYPGTWTRAKSLLVFPLPSRQLLGSDKASLCSNGRMAQGVPKFLLGLRLALAVFGRRGSWCISLVISSPSMYLGKSVRQARSFMLPWCPHLVCQPGSHLTGICGARGDWRRDGHISSHTDTSVQKLSICRWVLAPFLFPWWYSRHVDWFSLFETYYIFILFHLYINIWKRLEGLGRPGRGEEGDFTGDYFLLNILECYTCNTDSKIKLEN